MNIYLRLRRDRDSLPSLTLGPFRHIHITNQSLRLGPDSDDFLFIDETGDWVITTDPLDCPPRYRRYAGERYSDIAVVTNDVDCHIENSAHDADPMAHQLATMTSDQIAAFRDDICIDCPHSIDEDHGYRGCTRCQCTRLRNPERL